ncbi:glycoside hydrolase family 16 protein [Streptacidiphilus sp. PB12-B1b]|uniref:glycoside hydrolase family 16 protein n=1 Tax=Streptacidiphilus sp. PB12-B1b TaxID=2705012 RepID=UPI0015FA8582|nr:glycoside hydrolase family 16 protein [Streptacidiphilus sp. PB12-B1b]QMU76324.1 glycoside hydrolase family 16 protein [Streptacidiphilus sp. PB12-B1b]
MRIHAKLRRPSSTVRRSLAAAGLATVLSVSAAAAWSPPPETAARALAAAPPGSSPLGMPGYWNPVFDDEFDGTALDTASWTPNWLGCPGCTTAPVTLNESEAYAPSQVSVGGGYLHLQAAARPTTLDGTTYPYLSGMVQSDGKVQFAYGAFEARIYLPPSGRSIANWPAFWTDGQNWPIDGEMDVMEGLGGSACFHFHSLLGGPGGCAFGDFSGWHTYGADWEPGSVTYYYDGTEVGRITSGITPSPMYLILNYAVGGSGGRTVVPAAMEVDYVRVWQHCVCVRGPLGRACPCGVAQPLPTTGPGLFPSLVLPGGG